METYKIESPVYMEGVKRNYELNVVKGWKCTNPLDDDCTKIYFYKRGTIQFIIEVDIDTISIKKFDFKTASYLPVTDNDFHKFITITHKIGE